MWVNGKEEDCELWKDDTHKFSQVLKGGIKKERKDEGREGCKLIRAGQAVTATRWYQYWETKSNS